MDALEIAARSLGREDFEMLGLGEATADAIRAAGMDQADVVVALLRAGRVPSAERAAGLRVRSLPPDPRLRPLPWPPLPRRAPGPRVRYVCPDNPRLPTTDAWHRYRLVRRGMTRGQLLARGVTARDILELSRSGHLVLR